MKRLIFPVVLFFTLSCGAQDEEVCQSLKQPLQGGLIITEFMADPNASLEGGGIVDDKDGEWVEIFNGLPYTFNPTGMWLASGDKMGRLACNRSVPPGGYFLAARQADPKLNGGLPKVDCTYDKVSLLNSASSANYSNPEHEARKNRLLLLSQDGRTVVDVVPYLVPSAGFPKPSKGVSLQLCREAISAVSNDFAVWWYESGQKDKMQSGDYGTPGKAGAFCYSSGSPGEDVMAWDTSPPPPHPEAGKIFISEIMPDPKVLPDNIGEWFELYYCGSGEITLKGLFYQIDEKNPVEIKEDIRMLPGDWAVLANSMEALPGTLVPDGLFTGTLANTGARSLRLLDAQKNELSAFHYGPGSPAGSVKAGVSLQLCTNELSFCPMEPFTWGTSSEDMGNGEKGTPGSHNNLCVKG